jgi:hypothetical protein
MQPTIKQSIRVARVQLGGRTSCPNFIMNFINNVDKTPIVNYCVL